MRARGGQPARDAYNGWGSRGSARRGIRCRFRFSVRWSPVSQATPRRATRAMAGYSGDGGLLGRWRGRQLSGRHPRV